MPSDLYPPLRDPPFVVPPRSLVERICIFIPVLGWLIGSSLESERRKPRWDFIHRQLVARTRPSAEAWGDDPAHRRVAQILSEGIRHEFGWPNANFLPGDPLPLLLSSYEIDCEFLSVLVDVEERLGIKRLSLPPTPLDRLTLGQLVDHILTQQKLANSSS